MPLHNVTDAAHTIIHKLEQPHRYNYVLNCADGFQHHGFDLEDITNFARNRVANRYGVPAAEVDKHITVAPETFTTSGGMSHGQVKLALSQHLSILATKAQREKEAEDTRKIPAPFIPTPEQEKGTPVGSASAAERLRAVLTGATKPTT